MGQKKKSLVVFSLSKRGRTMVRPGALVSIAKFFLINFICVLLPKPKIHILIILVYK